MHFGRAFLIRLISASLLFALVIPVQAGFALQASPSSQQSLENEFSISLTMFSTLAAINAAGYDTGVDSPLNQRFKVETRYAKNWRSARLPAFPS